MENRIEVEKLTDQLNRTVNSIELKQKDLDNLVSHFTNKINDLGYNLFINNKQYQFKKMDTDNFLEGADMNNTGMETGKVQSISQQEIQDPEQFIYSDKFKKGYLMTSGTMFTGFMASMIATSIMKDKKNAKQIIGITFVAGLVLGGIYTSKLLK